MSNNPFTFIVCSPRSGSTWLRRMLGDHPDITAGSESGLFTKDGGFGALLDDFFATKPQYSLRDYVSEKKLLQLIRYITQEVYGSVLVGSNKNWLVEKTPAHAYSIADIVRVFPDARFIHLVRDGRDVAASIVHAGLTWKPSWPTEIGHAAAMWKRYNVAIMAGWASLRGESLYIVRYEDLLLDTQLTLSGLFTFIGARALPQDDMEILIKSHSFDTYRKIALSNFDQLFLRQGKSGGWRKTFSHQDINDFKLQAGDLLLRYGYVNSLDWN